MCERQQAKTLHVLYVGLRWFVQFCDILCVICICTYTGQRGYWGLGACGPIENLDLDFDSG